LAIGGKTDEVREYHPPDYQGEGCAISKANVTAGGRNQNIPSKGEEPKWKKPNR
jgi:hypothetical protein